MKLKMEKEKKIVKFKWEEIEKEREKMEIVKMCSSRSGMIIMWGI